MFGAAMSASPYSSVLEFASLQSGEVEREYLISLQEPELQFTSLGEQGPPGPPGVGAEGVPVISADQDNRLTRGADAGLYVRDDLIPDPLAYYILARS